MSEQEFQRHLCDTRTSSGGDLAEIGVGDAAARIVELRMVEGVEKLETELNDFLLCEAHVAQKSRIPVVDARPVEEAGLAGPESPDGLAAEDPRIEIRQPAARIVHAQLQVTTQSAVGTVYGAARSIAAGTQQRAVSGIR